MREPGCPASKFPNKSSGFGARMMSWGCEQEERKSGASGKHRDLPVR